MKYIFIIITFIFLSGTANATHLIGGNLGYEYIGQFSGNYRFKIILTTYTDCAPPSNFQTGPEQTIADIGVYEHDLQNSPMGGGPSKSFVASVNMSLVLVERIDPNIPNGCNIGTGTCIDKAVYEGLIDLPLNFSGYHVFYERCCRNGTIVNLVPQESMSFHAYLSPPLLENSSPVFTDDPVPFLCAGDTTTLLNSAIDPDGDMLVFSFVQPYDAQASSTTDPAPGPPGSLDWTINTVTYAGGYSLSQPFGTGGYTNINASTGLTTYYPPATGDYVIAVEIKEYRNGNLIGVTRRDLQVLVLSCPLNPAPNIDPTAGTTSNQFTIEEGETLCFDFGYDDPNGDSLTLIANGSVFDINMVNPNATINQPVTGLDTVSTEFCWTTACGQAQGLPYQFQVSVIDNGCPPKTTNSVYQITVNSVAPPTSITGDPVVCQFSTDTYTTQNIPNTTYNWTIIGGNITVNNGSSIDIQWLAPGTGTISLIAENQFGCLSEPITQDVTVTIAPTTDAGLDTTICYGDTANIVAITDALPGFTTSWTPNINMINETTLTPDVFPTDTTEYFILVDLGGGCFALDSVTVNVNIPFISAGVDTSICSGDSVQLNGASSIGISVWTPASGLSDDAILNPFASPIVTTDYVLTLIDGLGCSITDSVNVNVDQAFTLTTSNDTTICLGDCANLSASGATTYAWEPTVNDSTLSNPTACPTATETYFVYGAAGSCSDTAQITVTVNALTTVEAGLDVSICEGDSVQLNASGATAYLWTPTDSITNINIANPFVYPSNTTEYIVTGLDGLGCTDVDSVIVAVNPLPIVDAGEDTSICSGDSVQLNGSSSIGITVWTPASGLSDVAILNPFASPILTTEYVLTVIDGFGCSLTDTMDVTIDQAFTLTTSNDTTICLGDSANLSASGATTYAWEPATTLNDSTLSNPTASPTITETYIVYGATESCIDTAQITVTVNALTTVEAGLDVSICEGDSVQLNASGATTYLWTPADSITNINIANPFIFPSNTSEYIVTGTNGLGCTDADSIIVTVNPLPIVDAGEDLWVCPGDNVQLNGSGTDTPVWSPISGLSDPNIYTPTSTPFDTIAYILTVTDINLCSLTDTMTVYVNQNVPTDAGNDTTICFGDSLVIGGNPTAIGGTTYAWTPAGLIVDPSVSNPNVFPSVTTTFYVTTTNDTCTGLDSVIVNVNPSPIIDAGNDIQICIGDSAQLLASGGVSYLWTPSNTLTDDTIANPIAFPTDTTEYIVNATDVNGCVNSDTVSVIVNPLPSAFAGSDVAICFGDTTILTATGGISYSWSPTDSLSNSLNDITQAFPIITAEYIATVTDTNGCVQSDSIVVTVNELPIGDAVQDVTICIGDSTQLNVTGGDTYVWTPSTNLSDPNIADPWAAAIVTTNYSVEITDINGCTDTDTVLITINNLPNISAGNDIQICIGDTTQLLVTGGDTYLWNPETGLSSDTSFNPTVTINDTTEYIVIGTDVNGCINSDTVSVIINPLPPASAGIDVNICIGDTAQLTASGGQSYSWTNGVFLDDNLIFNPNATPDSTMEFIVTITDSNSCISTDSVIVNVFIIEAISDQTICLKDSVQLDVYGSIGTAYTWTPSIYLSDPNIANPYSTAQVDITYYVSVSDVQGCSDQDSLVITVLGAPIASFTSEIEAGCEGAVVQFTNTSIDGYSFDWLFGDGSTTTDESPTYVLPYGEGFTATLTVTNTNGCIDNSTFSGTALDFDDYFDIFIPNVFTPNGDGENDIFAVDVAGQLNKCSDLKIYNRWGQIIFTSTGGNTKWDGHTNVGQAVPEATYFFVIDINGVMKSGSVALFR
jgi:gliding motility-associated-like protein